MTTADAGAIAHELHKHLRFRAEAAGDSWQMIPFAPPGDIAEACRREGTTLKYSKDACAFYTSLATDGIHNSMAREWGEAETKEIAAAVNRLYGISAP